jgi:hypothetical protein
MAIPQQILTEAAAALQTFCDSHASEATGVRYAYSLAANGALLLEERPSFMNASEWTSRPLAKFRYSEARNTWSLYWSDSNERWHRVTNVEAAKDISKLLDVVVKDPLGVFWG